MSDRASITRRILASVIVLVLIALAFWAWHSLHKPTPTPQISRDSGIDLTLAAGRAPASIRSAVLYDCYEHARENVPPRNDTSQRANNWQPPPMPADLLRAAAAEKSNSSDAQLLELLKNWDAGYRAGKNLDGIQHAQLMSFLEQTKLPFETLFNLGSAMGFLENTSMAAIFHRAVLRRAAEEYKNLSPLHPAAPMLRAALPQMGMYWNSGDYPLLEQRFKIEMQLYPPLSQEGRKCAHSCAEAMFYQGHSREAADLMVTKVQHDDQAGDLSASDKQEMGWIVGIFYGPDRAKEAIAGLAVAAQSGGSRAFSALQVMAQKISMLPPDEMEQQLAALEKYKMSPEQIQSVRSQVTALLARRPPMPTTRQVLTPEQQLELRRRMQMAATQPTTRPVFTTQQAAQLAARRAAFAASRPTTRGTAIASQSDAAMQERQRQYQLMMEQQRAAATTAAEQLVPELRALLKSNPRQGIDRLLNRGGMQTLLQARRYDDLDDLAIAAIIAAARDTWQVEQLQRFRVAAFTMSGKSKEALSAARAQFNVAGMGSVPYDLANIGQTLRAAYPADPAIANRFRLQQLAGAQADAEQRKKLLADLGDDVMASIQVDPAPFAQAIKERQNAADYDTLYSLGNLLLVSGRISEAREVFERVYKMAPPGEVNYASEAIAKVIKAEDGCIGRANQFVAAIRPKD